MPLDNASSLNLPLPFVVVEVVEAGIVSHQDIGTSVAIEILKQYSQPEVAFLVAYSRLLRHLTECSIVVITIEGMRGARNPRGPQKVGNDR